MSEHGSGKLGYVLLITTRQVIESSRIGDQNASYLFYRGFLLGATCTQKAVGRRTKIHKDE
jgi:hypothetical protein